MIFGHSNDVYASCAANIDYNQVLSESSFAFVGTVVLIEENIGPQKVHFFVHEQEKGNLPEIFVHENKGHIKHPDGGYFSSSVSVDYQKGKTYNVYVDKNGETNSCTTKININPTYNLISPLYHVEENDPFGIENESKSNTTYHIVILIISIVSVCLFCFWFFKQRKKSNI